MLFNKVVLATDGSKRAEFAAGFAIQVVQSSGGELFIISVADSGSPRSALDLDPDFEEEVIDGNFTPDAEKMLKLRTAPEEKFVKNIELVALGKGVITQTAVRLGSPAEEILKFAEDNSCDLIVVGSRGRRPLTTALAGSVATSLVHAGEIPVLVIPAHSGGK